MIVKTYEQTEECTVEMSSALAKMCGPFKGDPKGPSGPLGFYNNESEKEQMIKILSYSGGYVLKGTEEDFICIPRYLYEQLIGIILQQE